MAGPGALLAAIRQNGSLTRAQLVAHSGLARATVALRLGQLIEAGYVTSTGSQTTGGRPAEALRVNETRGRLLVADIGSSHARFGLADLSGTVCASVDDDLTVSHGPEPVLAQLAHHFRQLSQAASSFEILGVAVGLPGPVDHRTGRLVSPPTMPGWDDVDVAAFLGDLTTAPVVVDKDANLVALGVHRALHRQNSLARVDDMVVIKVGMGVGAGVISRGEILRGQHGAAGDLGHIPREDGPRCRCGQVGCAEATASGWAIGRELRNRGHTNIHSSTDIVALAASGNRDAAELLRSAGRRIGDAAVEAVGVLNPALVVVGGDLAAAGDLLLAGIRERIYQRSHPLATKDLQVIASPLGSDAGLLGAAQMAADAALGAEHIDQLLDIS